MLADPSADGSSDAGILVPTSVHAAEVRSQRELFAAETGATDTGFMSESDSRDVARLEASLPHDIPDATESDPAAAALTATRTNEGEPPPTSAADIETLDFDVALFEAALPPDIPAPAENALAAASSPEDEPPPTQAAELDIPDFDVALFEASLPPDIPAPVAHEPARARLAATSPHDGKSLLTSAAAHPRNKTPAAKQPLRTATARGKTNDRVRISFPAARKLAAAAPPATTPRPRPRAGKADHGPRELLIGRVPRDDRDEVMPALRLIPVMRASLPPPPPALALK